VPIPTAPRTTATLAASFSLQTQNRRKTSTFATASEQKSARKRLLLAKIERESARKRKFLRGF